MKPPFVGNGVLENRPAGSWERPSGHGVDIHPVCGSSVALYVSFTLSIKSVSTAWVDGLGRRGAEWGGVRRSEQESKEIVARDGDLVLSCSSPSCL